MQKVVSRHAAGGWTSLVAGLCVIFLVFFGPGRLVDSGMIRVGGLGFLLGIWVSLWWMYRSKAMGHFIGWDAYSVWREKDGKKDASLAWHEVKGVDMMNLDGFVLKTEKGGFWIGMPKKEDEMVAFMSAVGNHLPWRDELKEECPFEGEKSGVADVAVVIVLGMLAMGAVVGLYSVLEVWDSLVTGVWRFVLVIGGFLVIRELIRYLVRALGRTLGAYRRPELVGGGGLEFWEAAYGDAGEKVGVFFKHVWASLEGRAYLFLPRKIQQNLRDSN